MAGIESQSGAGADPRPASAPAALAASLSPASSFQHFATIAWLRWRIFRNSLRGKDAVGELVVKILSYPFLALIILGPAAGACFASYYLVNRGQVQYLAAPLWVIFALWQFIGLSTSSTGPSFNLASLVRFPIRYRDYLLIRLSFGLLDPPTLSGLACLAAMWLGISIAKISLLPWAALLLALYGLCNIFFSRMIYSWMERWLAQRRTRELFTGLILIASLLFQFAAQFAQRVGNRGHHAPLSPFWASVVHALTAINWFLPPGLTAASIDHSQSARAFPVAVAALGGLLVYTLAFFLVLHVRLRAEFLGENLSEAPAASRAKAARSAEYPAGNTSPPPLLAFLPATIAACLVKEIRYMLRSGAKLYTLIMPVFVVFLFSVRSAGMHYAGISRPGIHGLLFTYGCAYTQLIFVALTYNALGSDGSGVQFYFIAPLRMRDVMLAKNLLIFAIFALEMVALYIASAFLAQPTPAPLTAATVAWSLFVLFLNLSIGNVRSIGSPRWIDPGKVRGQNVNGLSSLISLAVVVAAVLLGVLVYWACRFLHVSFWGGAAFFAVLAVFAFGIYAAVLSKLDGVAARSVETLTLELSKQ